MATDVHGFTPIKINASASCRLRLGRSAVGGEVVVVGAGVLGVGEAVLAMGFALDFGGRKNELVGVGSRVNGEGLAFHFVQVAEGYGFVERGFSGSDGAGLEFLELV